ncbi:MAG: cytochrome c oxidase assembly protein [Nitrososphaerales archaeon]|nr:cytochrome c oxidase assembly protein [Nitrososphaerales archaeon]
MVLSGELARRKLRATESAAALLTLAFSMIAGLAAYPPVDSYADSNLVFHMNIQHIGLVLAGVLVAYSIERLLAVSSTSRPLVRTLLRSLNGLLQKYGTLLLLLAAAVFVFWHIPYYFDMATENEAVHILEHALFVFTGTLIVGGSRYAGQNKRIYLFVLAGAAMMIFGGYMIFDVNTIYVSYPASQQGATGVGMLIAMGFMNIAVGAWWLNRFLVTMEKRGL